MQLCRVVQPSLLLITNTRNEHLWNRTEAICPNPTPGAHIAVHFTQGSTIH